jgi:hypothetical protein
MLNKVICRFSAKKIIFSVVLFTIIINSINAQIKLVYLNTESGLAGVSNNANFVQSVGRQQLTGYTNIYDIGNYSLLYYNINTGTGMLAESLNLDIIRGGIGFATGWTNIIKLNRSRILFYNKNTGKTVITNNTDFTTLGEPSFSPWTHITPLNEDMICFYNDQTGVTLVTDMNFNNLSPVTNLAKGYTQVVDIGNDKILFYNAANANNLTYKATNLEMIVGSRKDFSAGWTNIVNAGDNKILFYNKNNTASAVLDNTFTVETKINPIEKCHVITAYKSTNAFQESMVTQSRYVGGSISGQIHLPQEVLQNSTIWAKYKVLLYEVTDHPTDGKKYTYYQQIKLDNEATLKDLPEGSSAYDLPYKFTKVPFYKRFIVVFGDYIPAYVKADLRQPLYIAIENQQNYNLIGGYFANSSVGCRDCCTTNLGIIALDERVKVCTKANPSIKNDMEIILPKVTIVK